MSLLGLIVSYIDLVSLNNIGWTIQITSIIEDTKLITEVGNYIKNIQQLYKR
jgi:hypothetical protein